MTEPERILPGLRPRYPVSAPPPPGAAAEPTPIRSHAHAAETLDDAPFVAYALVQSFKLFIALVGKRWPQVR